MIPHTPIHHDYSATTFLLAQQPKEPGNLNLVSEITKTEQEYQQALAEDKEFEALKKIKDHLKALYIKLEEKNQDNKTGS